MQALDAQGFAQVEAELIPASGAAASPPSPSATA
jgi:hypothetical protein